MDPTYPRSLLFVPADKERFIEKAPSVGADVIIVDLEDSVAPLRKDEARSRLNNTFAQLKAAGCRLWLRINTLESGGHDDLEAAHNGAVEMILLPKFERSSDIPPFDGYSRAPTLAVTIETAAGMWGLRELLSQDRTGRINALVFGTEDYAADLGIEPTGHALLWPAQQLVLAGAANRLPVYGIAGSIARFDPVDEFEQACRQAHDIGFTGALCIHPRQVEAANRVFAPSSAEVKRAEQILSQATSDPGATGANGAMIDAPIIARARQVLARARGNTRP